MYLCICAMHMPVACGVQRRLLGHLKLEVPVVVSFGWRVLGLELRSSQRAAVAPPKLLTNSLALRHFILLTYSSNLQWQPASPLSSVDLFPKAIVLHSFILFQFINILRKC